jgi:hypothetical protein
MTADFDRNREFRTEAALESRRQIAEAVRNLRQGIKMFGLGPPLANLDISLGALAKLRADLANPTKLEAFRALGAAMHGTAETSGSDAEALVRLPKAAATREVTNILVSSGLRRDFRGRDAAEYRGRAPGDTLRSLIKTLGGEILPLCAFPSASLTVDDKCSSPASSKDAADAAVAVASSATENAVADSVDAERMAAIPAETAAPPAIARDNGIALPKGLAAPLPGEIAVAVRPASPEPSPPARNTDNSVIASASDRIAGSVSTLPSTSAELEPSRTSVAAVYSSTSKATVGAKPNGDEAGNVAAGSLASPAPSMRTWRPSPSRRFGRLSAPAEPVPEIIPDFLVESARAAGEVVIEDPLTKAATAMASIERSRGS